MGRFDQSLRDQLAAGSAWGKRNIAIVKQLGFGDDVREVVRVRRHEIDMFGSEQRRSRAEAEGSGGI